MISRELALSLPIGTTLYHKILRNADGSALRARINGKCKTWKRESDRFCLPMKHGLRECFYITKDGYGGMGNASADWSTVDPTEEAREAERIEKRKKSLRKKLNLRDDTPDGILRDAMIDANMSDQLADICTR